MKQYGIEFVSERSRRYARCYKVPRCALLLAICILQWARKMGLLTLREFGEAMGVSSTRAKQMWDRFRRVGEWISKNPETQNRPFPMSSNEIRIFILAASLPQEAP